MQPACAHEPSASNLGITAATTTTREHHQQQHSQFHHHQLQHSNTPATQTSGTHRYTFHREFLPGRPCAGTCQRTEAVALCTAAMEMQSRADVMRTVGMHQKAERRVPLRLCAPTHGRSPAGPSRCCPGRARSQGRSDPAMPRGWCTGRARRPGSPRPEAGCPAARR